jgi:hypothetical protein
VDGGKLVKTWLHDNRFILTIELIAAVSAVVGMFLVVSFSAMGSAAEAGGNIRAIGELFKFRDGVYYAFFWRIIDCEMGTVCYMDDSGSGLVCFKQSVLEFCK